MALADSDPNSVQGRIAELLKLGHSRREHKRRMEVHDRETREKEENQGRGRACISQQDLVTPT
jgi:hypothetical protein